MTGGWSRGAMAPAGSTAWRVEGLDTGARQLWPVIREQLATRNGTDQDERRLQSVLRRRRAEVRGVLLVGLGAVGPPAGGVVRRTRSPDGAAVAARRAAGGWRPRVRHRTDERGAGAARRARDCGGWLGRHAAGRAHPTAGPGNVDLRQGALEALPLDDGELDAAMVSLVLHHQPDPARVVNEAARVLRPGGRLLIVDMLPHDRTEYQQQMGHVWLGFSEETVRRYLADGRLHRRADADAAGGSRRARARRCSSRRDGRARLSRSSKSQV